MFRSIVVVAALSVASAATAQTIVDPQVTPDLLRQVQTMESVLAGAIGQAATKVSDRALKVVQDVKLRLEASPFAKGFVMPNGQGLFFVVEVPGIEATSFLLWSRYRELQQPNSGLSRTGTVAPPPPPIDLTATVAPLMTNPEKEYADYTRQSIVDAMLDAINLSLKEGQTLTVSVGSTPDPMNPLASSRRLYLTIKAEDLLALRQNTITRDEAKARIIEKRY